MTKPRTRRNRATVERLILHVGPHKTGTTAIQSALHENRELLLRGGVFVPVNEVELGQHIPVVRKFFPQGEFEKEFPWDAFELDIDDILKDMTDLGCHTLVLSSEHFGFPVSSQPVSTLLATVAPQELCVVVGMRPAIDYAISWFTQTLSSYEAVRRQPPQSFMDHVENRLAARWQAVHLAASIETWRSAVGNSSLEVMAFPAGIDVLDLFEQATGLSLPDRNNIRLNERLSVCSSRAHWDLQKFIDRTFTSSAELTTDIRFALDGFVAEPVPIHDCDCAEPVPVHGVETINKAFETYRDSLLATATRVWGDPASLDRESTSTPVVPRPPDESSHDLVLKMLLAALSKTGNIFTEMAKGNAFWQETALKHEEAAEFWRRQYEQLAGTHSDLQKSNESTDKV